MLVKSIVFRKLTDNDFFTINKPAGTEKRGGGQSYIDFSTSIITIADWRDFFKDMPETTGTNGPKWNFKVKSLGSTKEPQEITIAQRRPASVSIRSQKLLSKESHRVYAWRSDLTRFPKPTDPKQRSQIYDLHIYIVKLENGEYWAGWFQTSKPEQDWPINPALNKMFTENEGYLKFNNDVLFDTTDPSWPFRIQPTHSLPIPIIQTAIRGEKVKEKILFDEDEKITQNTPPKIKELIRKVRIRNSKAVKRLKQLYSNLCQISGKKYTFKKTNGLYYSEAHHLVPLGKGGADSVYNIVIVSPLIHRMLHYANIEGLDLKKIKNNRLPIKINGVSYTIKWHPNHAQIVKKYS